MWKRLERKLLWTLAIWAVMIAILASVRFIDIQVNVTQLLVQTSGLLDVSEVKWMIPVLSWLLPSIVMQYYLGDYISSKLDRHAVYLFTRTSRRGRWFISEFYDIVQYILFFQLVEMAAVVCIGLMSGMNIGAKTALVTTGLEMYVLSALGMIVTVLCINVLSLCISSVISAVIVLLTNVVCILSAASLYDHFPGDSHFIRWIPFTQQVYGWQYGIYERTDKVDLSHPVSYMFAFVYLIGAVSVMLWAGLWMIQRKDIY